MPGKPSGRPTGVSCLGALRTANSGLRIRRRRVRRTAPADSRRARTAFTSPSPAASSATRTGPALSASRTARWAFALRLGSKADSRRLRPPVVDRPDSRRSEPPLAREHARTREGRRRVGEPRVAGSQRRGCRLPATLDLVVDRGLDGSLRAAPRRRVDRDRRRRAARRKEQAHCVRERTDVLPCDPAGELGTHGARRAVRPAPRRPVAARPANSVPGSRSTT